MTRDLSTFYLFIEVHQTQHGSRHSNVCFFTLPEMKLKTVCSEASAAYTTRLLQAWSLFIFLMISGSQVVPISSRNTI